MQYSSNSLKISKETQLILTNFSRINNAIVVDEPNYLKTCLGHTHDGSRKVGVIAIAEIPESLPSFALYDLTKLISSFSVLKGDDLSMSLKDNKLILSQSSEKFEICTQDKTTIPAFLQQKAEVYLNSKNLNEGISFNLNSKDIKSIKRGGQTVKDTKDDIMQIDVKNGKGIIKFIGSGYVENDVYTKTFNLDNKDVKDISIKSEEFFLIMDGDYEVTITDKESIKFYNKDALVTYYITSIVQ